MNKALKSHLQKLKGGNMVDTKLNFFIPISKVDEEQRMVYGIATNSGIDKQNEIVDWEATKDALMDYSNWRNIREMHKPSAVGIAPIIEARDDKQEVFIGAKIIDDQAWSKCKEGVYKGFSIGGEVLDRKVEFSKVANKTVNRVTKYIMNEISIVDRPANPSCRFQALKRDTSIETITISEDPLKMESAKIMEKALTLAKKVLSKADLDNLPDSSFGLIKIVTDGDKLIKHRLYPMPDKIHAINMIKKMSGSDELTDSEKAKIHDAALVMLGKKHSEGECQYCINSKLKGGVQVEKNIEKGSVTMSHDPEKKEVRFGYGAEADKVDVKPTADAAKEEVAVEKNPEIIAGKPAEEQKSNIVVDEEVKSEVAPVADDTNTKLDRIISILEDLLGEETNEAIEETAPESEDIYEEEPAKEDVVAEEVIEEPVKEEVAQEEKPCECAKVEKKDEASQPRKTVKKGLLLNKVKAIIEPLVKENKELKARIEKMEKEPLPRKEAPLAKSDSGKVKIEKYEEVKLEKKETTFTKELSIDIEKATALRKSGKTLSSDETAFCQRVAEKMLQEKIGK